MMSKTLEVQFGLSFAYRKARACNIHIRAYSPALLSNWSCVPSSIMTDLSI